MAFWTYMLHCRGGYFYVGHTDDLEYRIAQHQSGAIAGFTANHQPVELVWSQDFVTRDEAKAAEKQIKGWSKVKKLALIRGDWDRISTMAKGKVSPSTSSGRAGHGESAPKPAHPRLAEGLSFSLHPHSQTPSSAVDAITAKLQLRDGLLWLNFEVRPATSLAIPEPLDRKRSDGLWQTTCFELFVAHPRGGYSEFNFSPSSRWAAYRFSAYRDGMKNQAMTLIPQIATVRTDEYFSLAVSISPSVIPADSRFALCAVIEEFDGTRSYWALAHPPGEPDFHHPACFAATLAAPAQR